jgi:hypothetical protein
VVLALLLTKYVWETDPTHPIASMSHITLTPRHGIKLRFRRRADIPAHA